MAGRFRGSSTAITSDLVEFELAFATLLDTGAA
jgi:hypothetical protein